MPGISFWEGLFNLLKSLIPGVATYFLAKEQDSRKAVEAQLADLVQERKKFETAREETVSLAERVKNVEDEMDRIDPDTVISIMQNLPKRSDG